MHVISRKKLIEFYKQPGRQDARGPLDAWYYEANHAQWASPADIKNQYRSASILKDNRVVFNIAGNKYRLVVRINYASKTVFVRFIGTHQEYDKINAVTTSHHNGRVAPTHQEYDKINAEVI